MPYRGQLYTHYCSHLRHICEPVVYLMESVIMFKPCFWTLIIIININNSSIMQQLSIIFNKNEIIHYTSDCTHSKESTPPASMCRWFRVVMDVVRWRLAWSNCLMSLVISLTCAGETSQMLLSSENRRKIKRQTYVWSWKIKGSLKGAKGRRWTSNLFACLGPLSFIYWLILLAFPHSRWRTETHGRCITFTLNNSPHRPLL